MGDVTFSPAVPTLTYQRVVEQIEHAILSGEIQPGQHLPSERDLMVQFSVSRPTVREALRVLQSQGLIASKPGGRGGPQVLPLSGDALSRSLNNLARIASLSLSELVQFRIVLESSACQLAAALRTEEQLEKMRDAVVRMEAEVAHGSDSFNRADLDFHSAIWEASHNALLRICGEAVAGSILNLMDDRMERSPNTTGAMQEAVERDRAILHAIETRDTAAAGNTARTAIAAYFADYLDDEGTLGLQALTGDRSEH
ncbi:GntR family transcriptional regulator [Arthrobacter crystallopoietes BAB-32]|uniref:GntR family transcriptional regulator n=1 Tax=Arthrobacter crystallopoietes BAB-32 TaxID=1246476 RepID=N1UXF7_9MICC|nr:FadR/GntR family transcriptional regulator [Arthrobacter crystallopoietes]EMY35081.1 GntR family transcriptional regulator [Arthrobacter crystallopoietes BAB-32]